MAYGAGLTRGARPLTHRMIETLRPAEAPYQVPDQRCKGLAVRVAPSGVKTWDLAYRIRGTAKMRRLSLGRTTDVSLEHARERANELTSAARGGRDLIAEENEARHAASSRITVEKLRPDADRCGAATGTRSVVAKADPDDTRPDHAWLGSAHAERSAA
jgi:hypothetical protein